MPKFHNAKVYSLAKLDSVAKNDVYITSDADVRVTAGVSAARWCRRLKRSACGAGFAVCISGTTEGGWSAKLDAVGKSVEMTSGVLVADDGRRRREVCAGARPWRCGAKSFQDVGGFNELGQFYADDFVLGNRLAAQGTGVLLATHVIRLMVQDAPFLLSFRNQLRWMQSTRRSRPWGHFGSGLTFAVPFGLMGLLWGVLSGHALLGVAWLAGTVVNRMVQAAAVLLAMGDEYWLSGVWRYPVRDFLGSLLWVGSYLGSDFYYRGKIYTLKEGGRVEGPE